MKKHVRFHHHLTFTFLCFIFRWYLFFRYNFKRKYLQLPSNGPHLIFFNHAANIDGYVIACSFRRPIYFVSTEHLLSVKGLSWLVDYLIAPIPIQKNRADLGAVRQILRVVKQGGSIGLSPAGNSTITGENPHLEKNIVKLVKQLNIPLAFCHITGNYMSNPRWGKSIRKGQLSCDLAHYVEPTVYHNLSDGELYSFLKDKLYFNAYEKQRQLPMIYRSDESAMYLERLLFICPKCRAFNRLNTVKNHIYCSNCDLDMKLDSYGFLEDNDFDFQTVIDWDNWQKPIARMMIEAANDNDLLFLPARMKVLEHVKTNTKYSFKRKIGNANFLMTKTVFTLEFDDKTISYDYDQVEDLIMADKNQLFIHLKGANTIMLKGEHNFGPYKYLIAYQTISAERSNKEPEYLGI